MSKVIYDLTIRSANLKIPLESCWLFRDEKIVKISIKSPPQDSNSALGLVTIRSQQGVTFPEAIITISYYRNEKRINALTDRYTLNLLNVSFDTFYTSLEREGDLFLFVAVAYQSIKYSENFVFTPSFVPVNSKAKKM